MHGENPKLKKKEYVLIFATQGPDTLLIPALS